MKGEKKKSLLWLWILLGCLGLVIIGVVITLVLMLFVFSPKKDHKVIKNLTEDSKFVNVVVKAVKDGSLNKTLSGASIGVENGDSIKFVGMDIDNDNKKDLVGYYSNNIITIDVNTKKEKIKAKEVFANVKDEASLQYAYSLEDDANYWIYEAVQGDYFVKGEVNKVIPKDEFDKNYYIIKDEENVELENVFDEAVEFNYGDKKINEKELEDSLFDNNEVLEDANITQEQVVEKAKAHKDELVKAEEEKKKAAEAAAKAEAEKKAKQISNTFTLNGKTLHYGKYSADPVIYYESIQVNSNGSAIVDGSNCTWSYGNHDFAQDSSTAGKPVQCIVLKCGSETNYLTAFNNDELGDGGINNYSFVG